MNYLNLATLFHDSLKDLENENELKSIFTILLEDAFKHNKFYLKMNASSEVPLEEIDFIKNSIELLKRNIPVQQITGKAYFYQDIFKVSKHTLVPRNETEELVDWVLKDHPNGSKKILDIGTGTGCIPISIALYSEHDLFAIDVCQNALKIAQENAKNLNAKVDFKLLDILKKDLKTFEPLDIIVSNPPYIPPSEKKVMGKSVLEHEPELALFVPENDPLLFYRRIAELGLNSLSDSGIIYFEINQYFAKETIEMAEKLGYQTELRNDLYDNPRMLKLWR